MNCLDFASMPAPFGGVGGNLFVTACAPVATVAPKPIGPPISQVIRELVAAKYANNRRPKYVRQLKVSLNAFAKGRENKPITEFDIPLLESWLQSRCSTPSTQRGCWGRLSTMFSFCKRKGYVTENLCSRIERAHVDAKPPIILSPADAEKMLRHMSGHGRRRLRLAQVVIGLFTGIRPTELTRLYWKDIELDRAIIIVGASASKVRQRRIVPIPPNAVEWLRLCPRTDKPLGAVRWKWIGDLERGTGLQWSPDLLRHTAASYLLAKHEDCGKVSRWLGNSPDILLRHYTELVSKEDADRYWSLRPSFATAETIFTRAERILRGGSLPKNPEARGKVVGCAPSQLQRVEWLIKHGSEETLTHLRAGWLCIQDAYDKDFASYASSAETPLFARVEAVLKLEPEIAARALQRQREGLRGKVDGATCDTCAELAKLAGCSRSVVRFVKTVLKTADADTIEKLRSGRLAVSGVYRRGRAMPM